MNEDILLCSKT